MMYRILARLCLGLALVFGFAIFSTAQLISPDDSDSNEKISPSPLGDIQARYSSLNLDVLDDGLAGEHIDIDTGSLTFSHMDISLPGNNDLPVQFGRKISRDGLHQTWTGNWTPQIPYVTRTYIKEIGTNSDRCTGPLVNPELVYYRPGYAERGLKLIPIRIEPESYFNGYELFVPAKQTGTLLEVPNTISKEFDGTSARMVTKENWYITCPTDGTYMAHAPNGDKYTFTHIRNSIRRQFDRTGSLNLTVMDETLYVSEITDVNGNWVRYDYQGDNLSRIHSNDGREITFTYSGNLISGVHANGRTWHYNYSENLLVSVINPDGKVWTFAGMHVLDSIISSDLCSGQTYPDIVIEHPYGAQIRFQFDVIMNGITHVAQVYPTQSNTSLLSCVVGTLPLPSGFYSIAVKKKSISLPSGETYNWTRQYEQDSGSYGADLNGLSITKKRTLIDPFGNETIFHINRDFRPHKGQVEKIEVFSPLSSTPLKTIQNSYLSGNSVGVSLTDRMYGNGGASQVRIYQTQSTTTQDRNTFTNESTYQTDPSHADFAYGQPLTTSVSSNVSTTPRVSTATYTHKKNIWVLGLVDSVTINGRNVGTYGYNTLGQKISETRNGAAYASYGYYTSGVNDGALYWVKDANNSQTTAYQWKRGKPQRIRRPDNISTYQYVDNNGWLTSTKDANGNTTSYNHDIMGRLTLIDPPIQSSTHISYDFSGGGAVQTITKGPRTETITYDSLFRPTQTNVGGQIYTRSTYDALGQKTFESFPSSGPNPSTGTNYTYDGLGRIKTQVTSAGTTRHDYYSSHRHRVTDPSGKWTDYYSYGYGGPGNTDYRAILEYANGAYLRQTYLYKNVWGEMTQFKQWGDVNGYSVNERRYYYYDAQRRICRYREEEGGDTVYAYDAAGQMTSYAKGLANGSSCLAPSGISKVSLARDVLGQVTLTDFTDNNTPDISSTYDANGNVTALNRGGVNWAYAYDALNALTSETLSLDGRSYPLSYTYDTNGYMTRPHPANRATDQLHP